MNKPSSFFEKSSTPTVENSSLTVDIELLRARTTPRFRMDMVALVKDGFISPEQARKWAMIAVGVLKRPTNTELTLDTIGQIVDYIPPSLPVAAELLLDEEMRPTIPPGENQREKTLTHHREIKGTPESTLNQLITVMCTFGPLQITREALSKLFTLPLEARRAMTIRMVAARRDDKKLIIIPEFITNAQELAKGKKMGFDDSRQKTTAFDPGRMKEERAQGEAYFNGIVAN